MRFFRDLFFRLFQKLDNRANRVLFYFTLAYLLLMVTPVIVFASSLSGTAAMLKAQYEASALSMVESAALQAALDEARAESARLYARWEELEAKRMELEQK